MSTNEYKVYTPRDFGEIGEYAMTVTDEFELKRIWQEVNRHKYDGDFYLGDTGMHEYVFRHVELPIIKKLYPERVVYPLVRKHVAGLLMRAKHLRAAHDFTSLRQKGLPYVAAKKHSTNGVYHKLTDRYSSGYRLVYNLKSNDADVLYTLGLEKFIINFYDRFYVPVQNVGRSGRADGNK